MTKFRWHRGGLAESMATVVDVPHRDALIAVVSGGLGLAGTNAIAVEPYGYDDRIGWDTHIVLVDGNAVGMTDGPMPFFADPGHAGLAAAKTMGAANIVQRTRSSREIV